MKRFLVGIYVFIVVLLAVATFVEAQWGTPFVKTFFYESPWFFACWTMLGVVGLLYVFRRELWQRPAAFLLHIAFGVMLIGAGITWTFGERGIIHLNQGEQQKFFLKNDTVRAELPFSLELQQFTISYYPGTNAPADYVSSVLVHEENGETISGEISMNNVLSYRGYRFYQTSYDENLSGTWLSINHDPIGIGVTYTGYLLMALSMIFLLFSKKCGFRKLLNHPLLQKTAFCFCLIFMSLGTKQLSAQETVKIKPIWENVYADSASSMQVLYHDRIVPFNTLARDFTLKLYGKTSYKGLTAEQVVGSWLLFPDTWKSEPMILVKNEDLRSRLGIEGNYAKYTDFFDENNQYKLRALWQSLQSKTESRSPLLKAITETDEKVALITMLQQGSLVRPLPQDGSVKPLSNMKIQAELFYNKVAFCKILFMINLTLGFLSLFWLLTQIVRNCVPRKSLIENLLKILLLCSLVFHTVGVFLHGYISGRIPMSNGYETMMFVAWCVMLIALVLRNKSAFIVPFGFLLSGFILLVAWLGQKNPQITPMMPVLHSPILSIHVSVLMMAYALYGFVTFNGIIALIFYAKDKETHAETIETLTVLSKLMLYPATFLMGIGIFVGAIWANISWGNYWSWDPKETWALITFLVYAAAFHTESVPKFNKTVFFHIFVLIAFLTVLMTYFGVNNLLGGMHSYK